ncbi:hypothetical protein CANARDRAFT_27392 [[Candida] arabinofermentans NRRL YB-2248]|uniref:PUM-HD domain-containing protein n=1 Tax=[Candida] arabinofermentans NRRL YB-2248 TaxID=983967 RepID=A0A1E4T2Z2_9ASCO|nr:hypothetical protein CANARDRAFT_27392 [[Candida] arabinofermentans NRRL YB-2248]
MAVKQKTTKRSVETVSSKAPAAKKTKFSKKVVVAEPDSDSDSDSGSDSDSVSESESDAESQSSDSEFEDEKLDTEGAGGLESESEDELDNTDKKIESEDELDDVSNDQEVGEEGQEEKVIDENKKSSREQHEEQKKLLNERKLNRKAGAEVQNIKKVWEKLRVKNPPLPKEMRNKLCDELWNLSKDVIDDLVLKHDASRIIQTLVKYSSKERRNVITAALKNNYYSLATSSYGKYLLVKLLHYGSKESRELILSELHGKLRKLMRHREGAYVVEDLYVLYASSKQKQQMIKEFWGAEYAFFRNAGDEKDIKETCAESTEKRKLIAQNLLTTIKASVEKGSTGFQILHAAMREYVQIFDGEEVREFIELLQDQVAELVHTPEGCEVACTLIAKATAKERKNILKGLKSHAESLATNEYGQMVLQVIFMTVDDTVLVNKTFSGEFSENMGKLMTDKFSRRPFIYLLNGLDKSYFSPSVLKDLNKYMELSAATSKKPLNTRRQEVLKAYLPVFYKTVIDSPYEILGDNMGCQFVMEVLLNNEFPELVSESRSKVLDILIDVVKGDIDYEKHLLSKPFVPRLLKTVIQGGKFNIKEKKIVPVPDAGLGYDFAIRFASELFDLGDNVDAIRKWIMNNQTSFTVVAIVDSCKSHSDEKEAKKFLKALKPSKMKVGDQSENKGYNLLVKILNE